MNYQAKHFTAPLFNKSKVLSGVLVTSSVLAGMLLVQNDYVSADSISAKNDISVTAKSLDQTDTKTVVEGNTTSLSEDAATAEQKATSENDTTDSDKTDAENNEDDVDDETVDGNTDTEDDVDDETADEDTDTEDDVDDEIADEDTDTEDDVDDETTDEDTDTEDDVDDETIDEDTEDDTNDESEITFNECSPAEVKSINDSLANADKLIDWLQHMNRQDFERNIFLEFGNEFEGYYKNLLAFKNGLSTLYASDITFEINRITESSNHFSEYLKKNNVPKTGNKPLTEDDKSGLQKEISDVEYTLNWAGNANTSDWSNTDKQSLNDYINSLKIDLIDLNLCYKLETVSLELAQNEYDGAYANYLDSLKSSDDEEEVPGTGGGSDIYYSYGDMFYLRGLLQKHNVLQPTTNNSSNSNTGSNGANSNTNNSSASSATNSTTNGTTHDSTNNSMTNTSFGANNNTDVVTAADVAKKAQIANLSNEQSSNQMKTLPQTGEKNQDNMAVSGILGLIAAMLGFVGISFRKRRN